jgi:hypothetical protein
VVVESFVEFLLVFFLGARTSASVSDVVRFMVGDV